MRRARRRHDAGLFGGLSERYGSAILVGMVAIQFGTTRIVVAAMVGSTSQGREFGATISAFAGTRLHLLLLGRSRHENQHHESGNSYLKLVGTDNLLFHGGGSISK
jgi:hypothetical protein